MKLNKFAFSNEEWDKWSKELAELGKDAFIKKLVDGSEKLEDTKLFVLNIEAFDKGELSEGLIKMSKYLDFKKYSSEPILEIDIDSED